MNGCLAAMALGLALAATAWLPARAQPAGAEEVRVEGLAGTLTRPAGATQGVLIIAGSGPVDRDGNAPGGLRTDTYKQLADALAKVGIASLRFDKRGIGKSATARDGGQVAEAALTINSFAEDAAALAAWLGRQPGIARVALVGHSEGGLLALLAGRSMKVDRIVLLAAPGRPMGEVLRKQLFRQAMPDDLQAEIERVLRALETGAETGPIRPPLDQVFRPSVHPFLRSVLTLDPAPLVKAQAAPILAVGGGSDLQIGRFDLNALVEARAGVASHWEPRLTHTLKESADDDPAQIKAYSDPTVPLMAKPIEVIIRFLKE